MGRKKPTSQDGESVPAGVVAGAKLKTKTLVIADDEYSIGTELSKENRAPVINKKKGKKGFSKKIGQKDEDDNVMDNEAVKEEEEEEEYNAPAIRFAGKKKKSGTNSVFSSLALGLLGEDEGGNDNETKDDEDEESGESVIAFSRNPFSAVVLDGEHDEDVSIVKTGDDDEGDVAEFKYLGKKKSSKKKAVASLVGNDDASSDFIEPTQHIHESTTRKQTNEDVAETSTKNKRKRNKGGKAGKEEDDLDRILAELGVVPPESKHVPTSAEIPPGEDIHNQPVVEEEKKGPAESVAAKKKKKKEKEKEKKAAAAEERLEETETEASNKLAGKKILKHVKEIQERRARLKDFEEKRKREEEEKQRKEEEERIQKEAEEKIAEEKRRLKREKEKEKLLKKKLEGKLLTGKQKEEARKREARMRQILANGSLPIAARETAGAPAKRPLYPKKKTKPQTQSNGAAALDSPEGKESKDTRHEIVAELDSTEGESVEDVASSSAKDKNDAIDVVQENVVDEDDEEWDAKSWNEFDLKLPGKSAFADEVVDSEPELLVRKEIKSSRTPTQDVKLPSVATKTAEKVASLMPQRSENVDVKKNNFEAEDSEKNNTKSVVNREKNNRKGQKSDDHPTQNGQKLRSPICCILGHVDSGKTKLLDCIRGTNVQEVEAGGITQQIGATYIPTENIHERTRELKADARLNVPGLLVIDTPGHESFSNLRSRGSGLCDIAVLVVDIMHGLKPQTIESLKLLTKTSTDFIVALNKVDKIFGWKSCCNAPIKEALSKQSKDVKILFNDGLKKVKNQLQEQGLNTELYYKNKEMGDTHNIVPTSALSGEGIPDLLLLLVKWTERTMIERLTYSDEVKCTVLEVKVVEGHGTTIDVVLGNGVLHEGDHIVVCGMQGPVVTSIRALLTPHPMKELRVKGTYLHHKEIKAAMGIKISAQGLEHTIAGTSLYVVWPHDDLEMIKEAAMKSTMSTIDRSNKGVYIQASTYGSLEALVKFFKNPAVNIPVSDTNIGPVHKKDVFKASVMLEKKKEYGTILAFDVKVTQEARDLADDLGVKIFTADIIYHLVDQFKAYIDTLQEERKTETADEAVFPCVLKIMPNCVFNKKDPIVLGVEVLKGVAKIGTPLCVPQREFSEIGRIASIEDNHKLVHYAKKGQKVAIKIIGSNPDEQQKMFGRHFKMEDELVSKISQNSYDAIKENYADDLSDEDKRLLLRLKNIIQDSVSSKEVCT
ncbi:hypothetical protein CASFOL_036372 [Castilleja foliolosa]|uniref:Eukaryotic translation initiation factor 5B n=1 Tax=Castilleja foliolosa TaxID=1961234 RepID=A0ABD3BXR9_9LAMI